MPHDIVVGNLVMYRSWRVGDTPKNVVIAQSQGWDDYGIVLEIADWSGQRKHKQNDNCGILFMNQHAEFIFANAEDLRVIGIGPSKIN